MRKTSLIAILLGIALVGASADAPMQVEVRSPIVLPFLAVNQEAVDSDTNGEINEAVGDFNFYLGPAADALKPYYVQLLIAESDTMVFHWPDGTSQQFVPPDTAPVGYVFAAPPRIFRVEYGVMTDVDIVCLAKRYFALKAPIKVRDELCP